MQDTGAAVCGGLDKLVTYHPLGGQSMEVVGKHEEAVRCVEHNPANGLIVSGSWDATVRLWDLRAAEGHGRAVGTLPLPGKVFSMSCSSHRLVVATAGRRVQVYDLRALQTAAPPLQQRESPLKHQTRCVRCTPDGRGFALSSVEGRVALDYFDEGDAARRFAFKCHRRTEEGTELVFPVNALAFHPVYGTFATGGCDACVNIWDGAAKRRVSVLPKYPTSIAALSFNHNGTLLAVASSYTWEDGERDHPLDAIFIRQMSDAECRPKGA